MKPPLKADEIIKKLDLAPHPEGGWYKRTYESEEKIGAPYIDRGQNQKRFLKTAIYYLLCGKQRSLLHRIKSDEMWHFYLGDPLTLVEITPTNLSNPNENYKFSEITLGPHLLKGEFSQNVGTGIEVTIKELALLVKEVVGFDGAIIFDRSKPDGTLRKLMDISLLSKLGWNASTSLKTGLGVSYADFLSNQK